MSSELLTLVLLVALALHGASAFKEISSADRSPISAQLHPKRVKTTSFVLIRDNDKGSKVSKGGLYKHHPRFRMLILTVRRHRSPLTNSQGCGNHDQHSSQSDSRSVEDIFGTAPEDSSRHNQQSSLSDNNDQGRADGHEHDPGNSIAEPGLGHSSQGDSSDDAIEQDDIMATDPSDPTSVQTHQSDQLSDTVQGYHHYKEASAAGKSEVGQDDPREDESSGKLALFEPQPIMAATVDNKNSPLSSLFSLDTLGLCVLSAIIIFLLVMTLMVLISRREQSMPKQDTSPYNIAEHSYSPLPPSTA